MMRGEIILDLCGGSGSWSKPYADAGYDVMVVDLKNGMDVRLFKYLRNVRGILAAPVCTVFAASGARWQRSEEDMLGGLSLVDACCRIILMHNPVFWSIEQPVGILIHWLGPVRYYFHPCDHGDPYTKKTCLWGKFNIPKKNPVEPTEGSKFWKNLGGKSERTKTLRSMTPPGFARAFFEANP